MTETYVNTADKLMKARCRLMMKEPFYGSIALDITWKPSDFSFEPEESARTMGVCVTSTGPVCIYYQPFVDRLSIEELYTVVQHEIEHLVRLHCIRRDTREPYPWNVAADMTIHGHRTSPKIGFKGTNGTPVFPDAEHLCWVPQDVSPDLTAEEYYKNHVPKMFGKCDGNCKPGGKGPECDGSCKGKSKGPKTMDNHGVWEDSDVGEDEARQMVNSIVQDAIQKNQGNIPGHLVQAVKALQKPVVRWRELLRHYLGQHVGNRRLTYSRRHRRNDIFGVKGVSHHAAATINVIVDTSGSIGDVELGKFFAEIEAVASRAKTHVLQWDHAFQGYSPYRRGNWKTFKVKGRGGTDMAAPYKWLEDNGKIADVQILLTDGYTGWPDKRDYPAIFCITTDQDGPNWGHVVRIPTP
jgi:predicted metal-dependent peptidase